MLKADCPIVWVPSLNWECRLIKKHGRHDAGPTARQFISQKFDTEYSKLKASIDCRISKDTFLVFALFSIE